MIDAGEFNLPGVVHEVRAEFDRYEAALLNHDVAQLNDFFLQRTDTARFGVAEHNYGAAEIAAWRRAAAPVHPQRRLLKIVVVTFGNDVANVSVEFQSPLSPQRGRQSQLWVRVRDGWKIAAAHVSLIDARLLESR